MTQIDTRFGKLPTYSDLVQVCLTLITHKDARAETREAALAELQDMGRAFDAAMAAPAEPELTEEQRRYITPNLPDGWDTVVGHMAKHMPEVLAYDASDPETTQRDGWWLSHRCRERGIKRRIVQAPPALAEEGLHTVRAYPVDLLRERFG